MRLLIFLFFVAWYPVLTFPPNNPMQLYFTEFGFGIQGFLEIESNIEYERLLQANQDDHNYGRVEDFKDYKVIVAKRKARKSRSYSPKVVVKGIIDLKDMKFTRDQYVLITTNNDATFSSSTTNAVKQFTNTQFRNCVINCILLLK